MCVLKFQRIKLLSLTLGIYTSNRRHSDTLYSLLRKQNALVFDLCLMKISGIERRTRYFADIKLEVLKAKCSREHLSKRVDKSVVRIVGAT